MNLPRRRSVDVRTRQEAQKPATVTGRGLRRESLRTLPSHGQGSASPRTALDRLLHGRDLAAEEAGERSGLTPNEFVLLVRVASSSQQDWRLVGPLRPSAKDDLDSHCSHTQRKPLASIVAPKPR